MRIRLLLSMTVIVIYVLILRLIDGDLMSAQCVYDEFSEFPHYVTLGMNLNA